jgi:E3 ubiquitin-protein ligase HUWE1
MIKSVELQLQAFLKGFRAIIPKHMINIFRPQDLQIMIAGLDVIDIEEMLLALEVKRDAYDPDSDSETEVDDDFLVAAQVAWFRDMVREYPPNKQSVFLQFVTGKL